MMGSPIRCQWQGDNFTPMQRFAKECDRRFVIGEHYRLNVIEERSAASHSHFFARLHELWMNLPEDQAERFPSSESLRKWCLIKGGYADSRSIVCASKAEAQRVAAFVKPMDEFAVVTVSEAVVTVYTAQSQSMRAMGKKVFQDSKDKVLEIAEAMVGVRPDEIGRAA